MRRRGPVACLVVALAAVLLLRALVGRESDRHAARDTANGQRSPRGGANDSLAPAGEPLETTLGRIAQDVAAADDPVAAAKTYRPLLARDVLLTLKVAREVWLRGDFWVACALIAGACPCPSADRAWPERAIESEDTSEASSAVLALWFLVGDTEYALTALVDLRMRSGEQGDEPVRTALLQMKANGANVVGMLAEWLEGQRAGPATRALILLREAGQDAMPKVLASIERLDRKPEGEKPDGGHATWGPGKDRQLLEALLEVLDGLGSPGSEEMIRQVLSEGEAGRLALRFMISSPEKYSAARIVEGARALKSSDQVPTRVYEVLGRLPVSDAEWPAVVHFVEEGGPLAKMNFLNSLVNKGLAAAEVGRLVGTVLRWTEDDDEDVRIDVINALVKLAPGDERTLALVQLVLSGDSSRAQIAMLTQLGAHLCRLGERTVSDAVRLSRSTNPEVRAAVMEMVGNCPSDAIDTQVATVILRLGIEDESLRVRIESIVAIGKHGAAMKSLIAVAMAWCSGKGDARVEVELLRAVSAASGEWADVEKQAVVAWEGSAAENEGEQFRTGIINVLRGYIAKHGVPRAQVARLAETLGRAEGLGERARGQLRELAEGW